MPKPKQAPPAKGPTKKTKPGKAVVVKGTSNQPLSKKQAHKLAGLVTMINRRHEQALTAARTALSHAFKVGAALREAKDLIPHREWKQWVSTATKLSLRTAQIYTRLSRYEKEILRHAKAQSPALLTVEGALSLVSKSKEPKTGQGPKAPPSKAPTPTRRSTPTSSSPTPARPKVSTPTPTTSRPVIGLARKEPSPEVDHKEIGMDRLREAAQEFRSAGLPEDAAVVRHTIELLCSTDVWARFFRAGDVLVNTIPDDLEDGRPEIKRAIGSLREAVQVLATAAGPRTNT